MRFQFVVLLFMALAAAGTFWYRSTENICPVPLAYHIGSVASEFNLSPEQVRSYLTDAESVWEKEAKQNLFYYTPDKGIEVNFIFDERQEMAESQTHQKTTLDSKRSENDKLIATIDSLRADFNARQADHQKRTSAYESKLNAYNEKVNNYNDQGGAPNAVYKKLEAEKNALNRESDSLNKESDTLNELAKKINELSQKSSLLVDEYNALVSTYNKEFGFSREFTQGDYQNKVINIYKFSDDNEVRKVLAHEFGHALGVDHVEGKSSIMYYLLEDINSFPTLSKEDKAAFEIECISNGKGQEIRQRIRAILEKINI